MGADDEDGGGPAELEIEELVKENIVSLDLKHTVMGQMDFWKRQSDAQTSIRNYLLMFVFENSLPQYAAPLHSKSLANWDNILQQAIFKYALRLLAKLYYQ